MNVTIPGALADHLAANTPDDLDTAITLAEGRRGRGRTLVITPRSTTVLHIISRAAEDLLATKGTPRAQRDAARLWTKRAGHAPAVVVHRFHDSGGAYDATQCRDSIRDGDLLVVEREQVVAFLRHAWPVAITAEWGELHGVEGDPRTLDDGRYRASVERAEQIAAEHGFRLDGPIEVTVDGTPAAIVRADAVRAGDTVLACFPEAVTMATATAENAIPHADPYTAAPAPYRPSCGCTACEMFADDPRTVVTLATDTPWQTCDPVPVGAPVLIRRPSNADQVTTTSPSEAHDRASRAAARVRTNPDPTDPEWRAALDELGAALAAQADVDPVARAVFQTEAADAAQLVTEAESADGTWRGEWIGQQADDALFPVEQPEHGALFTDRPAAEDKPEPIVVRMRVPRADLDRIRAKAAKERAAYRAEMDARRAAEVAQYAPQPQTKQAIEPRAVEGKVVTHAGRTAGTLPEHAVDAHARAALAALAGEPLAEVDDDADFSGMEDTDTSVHGALAEPRGHGRVAVYWIEAGSYVRPDRSPHRAELRRLANKLRAAGWTIERGTIRCVMAWRPTE